MKNCENVLRWLLAVNTIKMWLLYLLIEVDFFLTTPDFGHQIDIASKIVPPALFVNSYPVIW